MRPDHSGSTISTSKAGGSVVSSAATGPADIKYDFAAFSVYFVDGRFKPSIFTFGGDRETFDPDPASMQFLNIDNDTWRFSPEWR